MRIGLINQLHGRPGGDPEPPSWESIAERARLAEAIGFDSFVYEDALLYASDDASNGVWEAVAISGAIAAATDRIAFGPSVFNSPYRSPAMLAKIADTLDEISAGRFIFGVGAGNTPDSDYRAFGFPTDKRFSRFAEAITIIATLLREGRVDFSGEFYTVEGTELVLRGPRPTGPPINIAAGGPKMLGLVAEFADAWNWWGWGETLDEIGDRLKPIISTLDDACRSRDRDPATLDRTLDLYTVVPEGCDADGLDMEKPVTGSSAEVTDFLLGLGALGFEEVRCDVHPKTPGAIEAMAPVIEAVHAA